MDLPRKLTFPLVYQHFREEGIVLGYSQSIFNKLIIENLEKICFGLYLSKLGSKNPY